MPLHVGLSSIVRREDQRALKNKAEYHVQEFALWLQGVILDAIPEVLHEVNPDDGVLVGFSKSRHSSCILPTVNPPNPQPAGDNPSIQAQLNVTLNAHAETTREANLLRGEEINILNEKDDIEKDKSSTRIHKSWDAAILIIFNTDLWIRVEDLSFSMSSFSSVY